jgi:putative NADH-flavin reductase
MLDGNADVQLTLFVRNPSKLTHMPADAKLVQGDVLDGARLNEAVKEQDIVYANLTGLNLDAQARSVIASMQAM